MTNLKMSVIALRKKQKQLKSHSSLFSENANFSQSLVSSNWEQDSTSVNLRTLFKKEKEVKTNLKKSYEVKKSAMDNHHLSYLRESYKNCNNETKHHSSILSLERDRTEGFKETINQNISRFNLEANDFEMRGQSRKEENSYSQTNSDFKLSKGEIFRYEKGIYTSFELDKIVNNKIKSIKLNPPPETLPQLIRKSKEITYFRYTMNTKEEKIKREKETFQNKIDALRESISHVNDMKSYLEDKFDKQIDVFLKHLAVSKKKEKLILDELEEKKSKLEAAIKQIDYKKTKLKETLKQNKDYRNYLIMVKERKLYNELVLHIKKEHLFDRQCFLQKYGRVGQTSVKFEKQNTIHLEHMFKNIDDKGIIEMFFEYKYKKDNPHIYEDKLDILEDFKSLEAKNLHFLEEFNKNNVLIQQTESEYQFHLNQILKDDHLTHILTKRERHLEILKKSHKTLDFKSQHETIETKTPNENTKKIGGKGSAKMITLLKTIYRTCLVFLPNLQITEGNSSPEKKIEEIRDLRPDYLRLIEKALRIILQQYYTHRQTNQKLLSSVEKELELSKKEKNTLDQFEAERMKSEINKKKIMERLEKVYILPKRKVMQRVRPKDKVEEKKVTTLKTELILDEFKELLRYDSDF